MKIKKGTKMFFSNHYWLAKQVGKISWKNQ